MKTTLPLIAFLGLLPQAHAAAVDKINAVISSPLVPATSVQDPLQPPLTVGEPAPASTLRSDSESQYRLSTADVTRPAARRAGLAFEFVAAQPNAAENQGDRHQAEFSLLGLRW